MSHVQVMPCGSSAGVIPHVGLHVECVSGGFLCFPAQGQLHSAVLQLVIDTFLFLMYVYVGVLQIRTLSLHIQNEQ